jgi:MoxR-like ATPase
MSNAIDIQERIEGFAADFDALRREVAKVVVGEESTIDLALTALTAGGHVLLEGLPGTGKTTLVRALAAALDVTFQRIACTPDLMPADLIGTYVISETPQGRRTFEFQRGPLFANMVLADQINRAVPKTQSAFLEAMDDGAITVSTETFKLPRPYLVVAAENPSESEGTFPLPEAQVDRFFFKLLLRPASAELLELILDRTTEGQPAKVRKVVDAARLLEMGELVRHLPMDEPIRRWAVAVVAATQPDGPRAPDLVRQFVRYGAGPRGAQAMVLGAKVRAIVAGRRHVSCEDVRAVAHAALRHRLVLNYEGEAQNVQADAILDRVLAAIPEPPAKAAGA